MNKIEKKIKAFLENEAAYDLGFVLGMQVANNQFIEGEILNEYAEDTVQYLEWDEGYKDGFKFAKGTKK
jgi:hypothetical protein